MLRYVICAFVCKMPSSIRPLSLCLPTTCYYWNLSTQSNIYHNFPLSPDHFLLPPPPLTLCTYASDRVIENLRSDRQVMNTTFGSIFRLVNSYGRPPTQYITLSNTPCHDVLHRLTCPTSSRIVTRYTLFLHTGAFGSVGRERDEMIISGASHIPGDSP